MLFNKLVLIIVSSMILAAISIGVLWYQLEYQPQTEQVITIQINSTTPPKQYVPILERDAERLREQGYIP